MSESPLEAALFRSKLSVTLAVSIRGIHAAQMSAESAHHQGKVRKCAGEEQTRDDSCGFDHEGRRFGTGAQSLPRASFVEVVVAAHRCSGSPPGEARTPLEASCSVGTGRPPSCLAC